MKYGGTNMKPILKFKELVLQYTNLIPKDNSVEVAYENKEDVMHEKVELISAVKFHLMIMAICSRYMEQMQNMQFEDYADKKESLEELGLTNSKTYKDIIALENKREESECLNKLKKLFPGSIFMKWENFKDLCVKYGLVCGVINEYKGEIPEKNLKEIYSARQITLENLDFLSYVNKGYYSFTRVNASNYATERQKETMSDAIKHFHIFHDSDFKVEDLNKDKVMHSIFYAVKRYLKPTEMLIAAQGSEMGDITFEHDYEPKPLPLVHDDPIVFQLLPHGVVMIHSKWGDEANDPMLNENRL